MLKIRQFLAGIKALALTLLAGSSTSGAQSPDEIQAWRAAQAAGTERAYQEFLAEHPTSVFAAEAFRALVASAITGARPDAFPGGPTTEPVVRGLEADIDVLGRMY